MANALAALPYPGAMTIGPLLPYWWRVRRISVPSEVGTEWVSVKESLFYPR